MALPRIRNIVQAKAATQVPEMVRTFPDTYRPADPKVGFKRSSRTEANEQAKRSRDLLRNLEDDTPVLGAEGLPVGYPDSGNGHALSAMVDMTEGKPNAVTPPDVVEVNGPSVLLKREGGAEGPYSSPVFFGTDGGFGGGAKNEDALVEWMLNHYNPNGESFPLGQGLPSLRELLMQKMMNVPRDTGGLGLDGQGFAQGNLFVPTSPFEISQYMYNSKANPDAAQQILENYNTRNMGMEGRFSGGFPHIFSKNNPGGHITRPLNWLLHSPGEISDLTTKGKLKYRRPIAFYAPEQRLLAGSIDSLPHELGHAFTLNHTDAMDARLFAKAFNESGQPRPLAQMIELLLSDGKNMEYGKDPMSGVVNHMSTGQGSYFPGRSVNKGQRNAIHKFLGKRYPNHSPEIEPGMDLSPETKMYINQANEAMANMFETKMNRAYLMDNEGEQAAKNVANMNDRRVRDNTLSGDMDLFREMLENPQDGVEEVLSQMYTVMNKEGRDRMMETWFRLGGFGGAAALGSALMEGDGESVPQSY